MNFKSVQKDINHIYAMVFVESDILVNRNSKKTLTKYKETFPSLNGIRLTRHTFTTEVSFAIQTVVLQHIFDFVFVIIVMALDVTLKQSMSSSVVQG